ncbi:MAG: hypothetical protein JJ937_17890, partial [Parvibaculum sp.]|uniref:hypothetical protein n=1 Tax=Parvibaculum sp. TaxID=2024848 RepID=UPI001B18FFAB
MIRSLIVCMALVFVADAGTAYAQGLFGQSRDEYRRAESYIDQYGREVIYDPETGRVIAIVPRGERRYVTPSERRETRRRELGRDEIRTERVPLGE